MRLTKSMTQKAFYTPTEIAELMHISRVAVFKKIKNGRIKTERVGNRYIISASEIAELLPHEITTRMKQDIDAGVKKVVREYGETLKKLGKE